MSLFHQQEPFGERSGNRHKRISERDTGSAGSSESKPPAPWLLRAGKFPECSTEGIFWLCTTVLLSNEKFPMLHILLASRKKTCLVQFQGNGEKKQMQGDAEKGLFPWALAERKLAFCLQKTLAHMKKATRTYKTFAVQNWDILVIGKYTPLRVRSACLTWWSA